VKVERNNVAKAIVITTGLHTNLFHAWSLVVRVRLGSDFGFGIQVRFYDFNVWSERKHIEKLRYMHRKPVKRGLVERPEQWRWSSFRSYLYGEVGAVRVNYQEWPLEIERRPVEKFNDESRPSRPLIRKNRE
jgi:hypothetical protein